ncbi:MAG: restriction endonuclease subunit M, partial [Prevotella sp.]|nr:restriction endonuclease subunit M [Prevotella sp.]
MKQGHRYEKSPELLNILLKDHTTSKEDIQRNIFWATSDYEYLGDGYQYDSPILPHLITGDNGHIIMPRVLKSRDTQAARSRDMAEVFTPSWICNAQNNLIDEAWFGRKDVFNTEYTDEQGFHRWQTSAGKIQFPKGKTWKDYVRDIRLEITCGEAPYIVSRYDNTTG